MSDSVKEFLTVLANDDLEPGVKLGLITTASAHMIEEALCGIGRHDDRIILEALDALASDMRKNIRRRCAEHHYRLLHGRGGVADLMPEIEVIRQIMKEER